MTKSGTNAKMGFRRVLRSVARRALGFMSVDELGTRLVTRKASADPSLRRFMEMYSLDQAREHFADIMLETRYLQEVNRYFHARLVQLIYDRLGPELSSLSFLDVGDTDGLILKHLGKQRLALNNSSKACEQIRRNGVEAQRGDGQTLPFKDKSFDVVLCFETLEHVLNPCLLLDELARVARRKVYVSIPGVRETLVHARIRGSRVGEFHVVEFCERDFRSLLTHVPLRISHYERIEVFGTPRNPREWVSYRYHATRDLLGGCLKFFQFYELEPTAEDQGLDMAAYYEPYGRRFRKRVVAHLDRQEMRLSFGATGASSSSSTKLGPRREDHGVDEATY